MGRRRTGAKPWSTYSDRGIACIDTTVAKKRYRRSLGIEYDRTRDVEEAAAKAYAQIVAGRVVDKHERIATAHRLDELMAKWLGDMRQLYPKSYATVEIHAGHIVSHFDTLRAVMADDAPNLYGMERLKKVLRYTVYKETATLFRFYEWCKAHGYIVSIPERPTLPRGMKGSRSGTQRAKPVILTRDQIAAIIAELPVWAARGGKGMGTATQEHKGAFLVRPRYQFAYETALRPSSVEKLLVPLHWMPGRKSLALTDDIVKNGNGKELPLTPTALAILKRHAPKEGPIFGRHDCRNHLKAAAEKVLGKDDPRAKDFAAYDFRHGRATHILSASGNLVGTQYMLGHTRVTTTNRYVHSAIEQAQEALAAEAHYVRRLSGRRKPKKRRSKKPLKTRGAKEGT